MATPKSERLLNLLIMLLVQRRPIPKDRIRELLYQGSRPDAFEKMFERDKDELRGLGIPIEVAAIDPYFDDEQGYRIRADDFALPDLRLTAEEASVVALATRTWQHATMARAATDAVRKMSAAGVPVDLTALEIAEPRLVADEPAFADCWAAVCERWPIRFDYRKPEDPTALTRTVEPWGVVRSSGRWYLVGHDRDRAAERVFRLDRVEGPVRRTRLHESYDVPTDVDLRETIRRLAPRPVAVRALLLARPGTAHAFRRRAVDISVGVVGPDGRGDWDRLVLERPARGLVDEILYHGPDVVLEEPSDLRDQLIARLTAVLA